MKNIIVTGIYGNLGSAVATKFLDKGFRVIGTTTRQQASEFANNGNVEISTVDLMQEDNANSFVKNAIEKFTLINVAVLTVGGFVTGDLEKTRAGDIQEQIQLNFATAWNVAQPIFSHMMQQGKGRIFLIGSKAGWDLRQSKSAVAYGMSKSLIFRLGELLNEEAKGTNVVTSVVIPSIIDTAQNRKSMPDADFSKWVEPGAIADLIFFYSSPEAEGIREPVIKIYNNS